jgi:hypothetical protein
VYIFQTFIITDFRTILYTMLCKIIFKIFMVSDFMTTLYCLYIVCFIVTDFRTTLYCLYIVCVLLIQTLGLHCIDNEGCLDISLYSPYWLINKTGKSLYFKVRNKQAKFSDLLIPKNIK